MNFSTSWSSWPGTGYKIINSTFGRLTPGFRLKKGDLNVEFREHFKTPPPQKKTFLVSKFKATILFCFFTQVAIIGSIVRFSFSWVLNLRSTLF